MISLDIILPAYNPLPGWEENVIKRFLSLEKAMPEIRFGLYIVNDGSELIDDEASQKMIKSSIPDLKWVSYSKNRGKGYALRQGVMQSDADFVLYTDIDWPYTEESMVGLISKLTNEADAVIGTRDEAYYSYLPPARRRISRLLRKINASLLRLKVDDTQAGLKGFRKKIKEDFLATTIDRYLFDLEFIYLISKNNDLTIVGYPISLRPGISFSKMNRTILMEEAGNFLKIWLEGKA
jgi:glycosyltransferase involved in cell wall biosynthesis